MRKTGVHQDQPLTQSSYTGALPAVSHCFDKSQGFRCGRANVVHSALLESTYGSTLVGGHRPPMASRTTGRTVKPHKRHVLSHRWSCLTCSTPTGGQLEWRHRDSFSASWWTLSRNHEIWAHSCPNFSPAWAKPEWLLLVKESAISHKDKVTTSRPLEVVSRGSNELVDLWRTFPAESPWCRQLAHAGGSDQLWWAANPDVDKKKKEDLLASHIYFCVNKSHTRSLLTCTWGDTRCTAPGQFPQTVSVRTPPRSCRQLLWQTDKSAADFRCLETTSGLSHIYSIYACMMFIQIQWKL